MKEQEFYRRMEAFLERQNPRDTTERDLLLAFCQTQIVNSISKLDTDYEVDYENKIVSVPNNLGVTQEELNYFKKEGFAVQYSL